LLVINGNTHNTSRDVNETSWAGGRNTKHIFEAEATTYEAEATDTIENNSLCMNYEHQDKDLSESP